MQIFPATTTKLTFTIAVSFLQTDSDVYRSIAAGL
jgi:hypothetical protein